MFAILKMTENHFDDLIGLASEMALGQTFHKGQTQIKSNKKHNHFSPDWIVIQHAQSENLI